MNSFLTAIISIEFYRGGSTMFLLRSNIPYQKVISIYITNILLSSNKTKTTRKHIRSGFNS